MPVTDLCFYRSRRSTRRNDGRSPTSYGVRPLPPPWRFSNFFTGNVGSRLNSISLRVVVVFLRPRSRNAFRVGYRRVSPSSRHSRCYIPGTTGRVLRLHLQWAPATTIEKDRKTQTKQQTISDRSLPCHSTRSSYAFTWNKIHTRRRRKSNDIKLFTGCSNNYCCLPRDITSFLLFGVEYPVYITIYIMFCAEISPWILLWWYFHVSLNSIHKRHIINARGA